MIVTYELKKPKLLDLLTREEIKTSKKFLYKIVGHLNIENVKCVFVKLEDEGFIDGSNQWITPLDNLVEVGFLEKNTNSLMSDFNFNKELNILIQSQNSERETSI